MTPSQDFIDTFAELADYTRPKCGACRAPHACCSKEQCEDVRSFAEMAFGVALEDAPDAERLPFLGAEGCVVPPHLRPICSVHVCEQHFADEAWSEKYWELRERANILLDKELDI